MQFLSNLTAYTLTAAHGLYIELLRRELDGSVARVNAGELDVLRDSVSDNLAVLCHSIHLDLLSMLDELAHNNRVVLAHVSRKLQESLQLVLVRAYIHGSAREHVRRTNEYREADTIDEAVDVIHACEGAPLRLVDAVIGEHLRELRTVLSVVDVLSLCTEDRHVLLVEEHSEVVRNLTAGRYDHAVRLLEVDYIHNTLEGELVEVETVAHIVVGRHGLRVIVDHNRAVALLADSVQSLNATPVELYRRTDAVSTRTEYDDRAMVVLEGDVALDASVCYVQIVGLCRILGSQGINLLNNRQDAVVLTTVAHDERRLAHRLELVLKTYGACNLEVGEAVYLSRTQEFLVESVDVALLHSLIDVDDVLELLEEPLVDLCKFVNLVDGIALVHSLRDDKHALVGRLAQSCVDIFDLKLLVLNEAVHTLTDHAQTLLDSLLEVATDSHYLAYRLH